MAEKHTSDITAVNTVLLFKLIATFHGVVLDDTVFLKDKLGEIAGWIPSVSEYIAIKPPIDPSRFIEQAKQKDTKELKVQEVKQEIDPAVELEVFKYMLGMPGIAMNLAGVIKTIISQSPLIQALDKIEQDLEARWSLELKALAENAGAITQEIEKEMERLLCFDLNQKEAVKQELKKRIDQESLIRSAAIAKIQEEIKARKEQEIKSLIVGFGNFIAQEKLLSVEIIDQKRKEYDEIVKQQILHEITSFESIKKSYEEMLSQEAKLRTNFFAEIRLWFEQKTRQRQREDMEEANRLGEIRRHKLTVEEIDHIVENAFQNSLVLDDDDLEYRSNAISATLDGLNSPTSLAGFIEKYTYLVTQMFYKMHDGKHEEGEADVKRIAYLMIAVGILNLNGFFDEAIVTKLDSNERLELFNMIRDAFVIKSKFEERAKELQLDFNNDADNIRQRCVKFLAFNILIKNVSLEYAISVLRQIAPESKDAKSLEDDISALRKLASDFKDAKALESNSRPDPSVSSLTQTKKRELPDYVESFVMKYYDKTYKRLRESKGEKISRDQVISEFVEIFKVRNYTLQDNMLRSLVEDVFTRRNLWPRVSEQNTSANVATLDSGAQMKKQQDDFAASVEDAIRKAGVTFEDVVDDAAFSAFLTSKMSNLAELYRDQNSYRIQYNILESIRKRLSAELNLGKSPKC